VELIPSDVASIEKKKIIYYIKEALTIFDRTAIPYDKDERLLIGIKHKEAHWNV